jgi:hypothetical protein
MSVVVARRGLPYPMPAAGRPLRLAFVGQGTFFEACALDDGVVPGITTEFIEFRKDADAEGLLRNLRAFAPHVVVVFRPEIIPAGALRDVRAPVVGFLTEPIPRTVGGQHHDLQRRLWELQQVDVTGFDRVVAFDPLITSTAAEILPVWRSVPLPVADRFYRPVTPMRGKPRVLFVGRSTEHREHMLAPAKALFPDLLHMAFGVGAGELEELMDAHDVALNVHNDTYLSFENRVCLHLAAGHLVISEPLSPTHGLEHDIDYLPVGTADGLAYAIERLHRFPMLWHRVRVRGRQKAEGFRASHVWPRMVDDLLVDLAAFGTERASSS